MTAIDAKAPQGQPASAGEATQTGGSATTREPVDGRREAVDAHREAVDGQTPPSTFSTNASDAEADVDGARDASTAGNEANAVNGVRAG